MKQTIKDRILISLRTGQKRYSELLEAEQDSVLGYKKYLRGHIKYMKSCLGKNLYVSDKDAEKVIFAYEQFIKEMPNNGSMNKLRNKLGKSRRDFEERSIHISFSSYLSKLIAEGKITRIKRGLYQITK